MKAELTYVYTMPSSIPVLFPMLLGKKLTQKSGNFWRFQAASDA